MNTPSQKSAMEMQGYTARTKGVSNRVKNITVSAIKEMMFLAQDFDGAISLAQGTPSFKTPEHIREAIKKELDENLVVGKYSVPFNGIKALREAIAAKLKTSRGIDANPKTEIYVTVGAMEGIYTALMTVVNPGDEVILLSPCFPSHIVQVELAEAKPVYATLKEADNWALDVEAVKVVITDKTKAIVMCTPANPTGTVFTEEDIRAVAKLAEEHDFWMITDEPYDFLIYDDHTFFSASQISEIKDRLISCFSLSKEYAMTGYRIGYVYAESGVINQMLKMHDSMVVCAPTISQYAALAALTGPQECVEEFKAEFAKRRDVICARLDKLPQLFSYQKPEGSYYIFPKVVPEIDDFELAIKILKEAKVITVPGSAFGPTGKGHLRLCYAMSEEDINEAFDRLEEWAAKM